MIKPTAMDQAIVSDKVIRWPSVVVSVIVSLAALKVCWIIGASIAGIFFMGFVLSDPPFLFRGISFVELGSYAGLAGGVVGSLFYIIPVLRTKGGRRGFWKGLLHIIIKTFLAAFVSALSISLILNTMPKDSVILGSFFLSFFYLLPCWFLVGVIESVLLSITTRLANKK
jgi:hypothetical protein